MKKYIILLFWIGLITLFFSSCEKYLDKAPISTFTPEEVFSNFGNIHLYFDAVYKGQPTRQSSTNDDENLQTSYPLYIDGGPRKFSIDQLTDLTVGGRIREDQPIRLGTMGTNLYIFYDDVLQRPQLTTMFRIIRKCNTLLENIGNIKDAPTQEDIYDLIAQAHFVRAYAHYDLFRFWGPMPYIDKVIGPYDQWDIPRLSKYETCKAIANDFDTAYTFFAKAGKIRRDNPTVGGVGHLDNPDMFRPNGVAAKAFISRMLLYGASPLNNAHGAKDWEDAAKASWEAIQLAEQNGYFLLSAENYKRNWVGSNYSDEAIWAYAYAEHYGRGIDYTNQMLGYMLTGYFSGRTDWCADCPTQSCIDRFETKWGDALNTPEDREAATTAGNYNEQDPFVNRDPRFYIDILYNQAPVIGYEKANIYWEDVGGTIVLQDLIKPSWVGITYTGYFQRKWWGDQSVKNNIRPFYCAPIIRLAELYLNYAEAANEAYGPNAPAPGATLTAVQAINVIRQRIGQADVQSKYTGSKEAFRDRIKNERIVELCFETHYFFDERRWMDAPKWMAAPNMGVDIQKVPVSAEYPAGFKYTRKLVQADHQTAWKDAMYYFPFYPNDYFKMRAFDMSINPYW